jgi:hypothetical protein
MTYLSAREGSTAQRLHSVELRPLSNRLPLFYYVDFYPTSTRTLNLTPLLRPQETVIIGDYRLFPNPALGNLT